MPTTAKDTAAIFANRKYQIELKEYELFSAWNLFIQFLSCVNEKESDALTLFFTLKKFLLHLCISYCHANYIDIQLHC